ncbi:hypothetical protein T07_11111 [Trichinella nelsoni]|uniref:Uncharacterized protein n=1 Tax=Trichinella nelsoni TaxID=6336 RepID=A0A0V0SCL0_9BILA|nr:hypothetical protein T07_11111 [Trichinella nelsoni]
MKHLSCNRSTMKQLHIKQKNNVAALQMTHCGFLNADIRNQETFKESIFCSAADLSMTEQPKFGYLKFSNIILSIEYEKHKIT